MTRRAERARLLNAQPRWSRAVAVAAHGTPTEESTLDQRIYSGNVLLGTRAHTGFDVPWWKKTVERIAAFAAVRTAFDGRE